MKKKVYVYDSYQFMEKWKFLIPTSAQDEFRDDLDEICRQSFADGELYAEEQGDYRSVLVG